jgi:Predicted membrane protein
VKRIMILWVALGVIYVAIEILWRGHSHISMLVVGGLCGVLVGAVNQIPVFYRLPIIAQSIIGASIVLLVEFFSGCILNLWLGLNVWDYSDQIGNIAGQVCLLYAFLWVFLMPFAIWAEDTAHWLIYSWEKLLGRMPRQSPMYEPYTLLKIYKDFFTGK